MIVRLRLAVQLEATFADDPKMRIYVLCLHWMTSIDLTPRDSRNQATGCFVIFLVFQFSEKSLEKRRKRVESLRVVYKFIEPVKSLKGSCAIVLPKFQFPLRRPAAIVSRTTHSP